MSCSGSRRPARPLRPVQEQGDRVAAGRAERFGEGDLLLVAARGLAQRGDDHGCLCVAAAGREIIQYLPVHLAQRRCQALRAVQVRVVEGVVPGQVSGGEHADGLRVVGGRGQAGYQSGEHTRGHLPVGGIVQAEGRRVPVQLGGEVPRRIQAAPGATAQGVGQRVHRPGGAYGLPLDTEDPGRAGGRGIELLLGRQLLAAEHEVAGHLVEAGLLGGLPGTQPCLVGPDRVADDEEVLHMLGETGLFRADPAAQIGHGDLRRRARPPGQQVGPLPAQDERRLVHDPDLERVGDLLHRRDVGARHLVPADLVLGGLLDGGQHGVELAEPDRDPAAARIEIRMRGKAMGEQLGTAALERRPHALAPLDARVEVAGEGQHLLGRARTEVVVVRADDAVGAAQRLAERGGQRAAPALQLGLGMVPVLRRQVGGDLAEAVPFQQVVDDDEGGQVGLAVLGEEVRQPDDGVLLAQLALELVDAAHVVGGKAVAVVERVVHDHADRARVGLELHGRHSVRIADVIYQHLNAAGGAPPGHRRPGVERALVLEVQLGPEQFLD